MVVKVLYNLIFYLFFVVLYVEELFMLVAWSKWFYNVTDFGKVTL